MQSNCSLEEPAKKLIELCLIHILDVSANQFQKLRHLNLCCYAEQDKQTVKGRLHWPFSLTNTTQNHTKKRSEVLIEFL